MEVILKPPDVIRIGMRQQERIHVQPPGFVTFEPFPKLCSDVGSVVIRIVGSRTDVYVDEDPPATLKFNKSHVAVADAKVHGFNHLG
jgi:hypothetical protein